MNFEPRVPEIISTVWNLYHKIDSNLVRKLVHWTWTCMTIALDKMVDFNRDNLSLFDRIAPNRYI